MKPVTRIACSVKITGQTWQGFDGSIEHAFNHEPSHEEIMAKAGDFQFVTGYTINKTESVETRTTKKWPPRSGRHDKPGKPSLADRDMEG